MTSRYFFLEGRWEGELTNELALTGAISGEPSAQGLTHSYQLAEDEGGGITRAVTHGEVFPGHGGRRNKIRALSTKGEAVECQVLPSFSHQLAGWRPAGAFG